MMIRHVYGSLSTGNSRDPGYDKIVEMDIVESGKYKGMVRVSVGRQPKEGVWVGNTKWWSRFGKRVVKTGYIPAELVRALVEEHGHD